MSINLDNFITLEKVVGAYTRDDTVAINQRSMTLRGKVAERFAKDDKLYVAIQYSSDDKALRLLAPEEVNHDKHKIYHFTKHRSRTGNYSGNIPHPLKKLHPRRGTYVQLPDHPNIFQFSEPFDTLPKTAGASEAQISRYHEEDPTLIEEGDIISWISRPQATSSGGRQSSLTTVTFCSGIVRKLKWRSDDLWFNLAPISKNYRDIHDRATVTVKADNVILREKANANHN